MKLPLLSFILMLNISLHLCAQTREISQQGEKSSVQPANPSATIRDIREKYNHINSLVLLKEKFKYEVEGCVEDGTVTYFKEGNAVVKITESGSIGDGSWQNEYYYHLGKFFFCYEKMVGGPAIGKVTTTERRYYVRDDKPVRLIEDKKTVKDDARVLETTQNAYKLLKAYKTKDFATALCR